jgi:phosphotransferase system enzyme I (PtsP)
MNIPHALSLVIQRSHSLPDILDKAVQIVAKEMGMDVCSIYLLDPHDHRLRLMATHGLEKSAIGKVHLALGEGLTGRVVAEMRSLAVEDASSHPGYRYFPETKEERFQSFLGVPMAIRNRPVGAIVVQTLEKRAYSEEEVQMLATIAAQLVGVVENARLIDALDRGEEGSRYLREVRQWQMPPKPSREQPRVDIVLDGSPASPGIAIGDAVLRGSHDLSLDDNDQPFQGAEAEKARVRDALEKTSNDILKIQKAAEQEADEEHALIFSSHLLLLNDPVLQDRIDKAIAGGVTAPVAVHTALEEFGKRLQNVADSYIQERVEDIHDLRSRILGHLLSKGKQPPRVSDRIVVTRGLPPSLVVELKAEGARGLVTEAGGVTSHGALLARSMGIPAVTGVRDIVSRCKSGDRLIVDGFRGKLILNPSPQALEEHSARLRRGEQRRTEHLKFRDLPGRTADGVTVPLMANIAVAADLKVARENAADGVGLYRTEFPFIIREHFPTREEQVRIYAKAYSYFPDGPINFRILDLGGDKFLPSSSMSMDRDPFRGYRSIRVLFDYPHVLRDQVQAFSLAAGKRPLSILIPMVSSMDELRRVKKMIAEAIEALPGREVQRQPRIGVMIELPAAVEIAATLAREVDYLSVGTNDLIQYALVIDRENSRIASVEDPFHPAILSMIRRTVLAGHSVGKPVSVCGEMANKRLLALALVAIGVDALSITPGAIPELKRALAGAEVKPLVERVESFLTLPDASSVERELKSFFPAKS